MKKSSKHMREWTNAFQVIAVIKPQTTFFAALIGETYGLTLVDNNDNEDASLVWVDALKLLQKRVGQCLIILLLNTS